MALESESLARSREALLALRLLRLRISGPGLWPGLPYPLMYIHTGTHIIPITSLNHSTVHIPSRECESSLSSHWQYLKRERRDVNSELELKTANPKP